MRFEDYLITEARGIRAEKIGKLFKFVGGTGINGDKNDYILQNIEDVPVDKYENYLDSLHGNMIITANKYNKSHKICTFLFFTSETGGKKIVIIRFANNVTNIQSKDVGMKLLQSSESFKMKPQDFKIPFRSKYEGYVQHIKIMIDMLYRQDKQLKNYLDFLVDYVIMGSKAKIETGIDGLPLNQIGKNFGEIIGPIALFNNKKLFNVSFDKQKDFILMPTAGNEKLLDYIIEKDGVNYNFSAKYESGAASSLSSIYDIIQKNPNEFTMYVKELDALETITQYSSIEAPVVLCKKWGFINEEQWQAWRNKDYNSPVWDELKRTKSPKAKDAEKVKEKPWWILAIMAYMSADYMNSDIFNFRDVILKAMSLVSVTQINMYLSPKGIPSFKVSGGESIKDVVVKIDAKKGYFATDRPKQKMSFKIKTK
jgi:hypothetical protein